MRIVIITVTIFLSLVFSVYAQDKSEKELVIKLVTADTYFETNDYLNALKIYLELYETDSLNPKLNLNIGICLFNLRGQKGLSKKYFEKATEGENAEPYYYLGRWNNLRLRLEKLIKRYQPYQNNNEWLRKGELGRTGEQNVGLQVKFLNL